MAGLKLALGRFSVAKMVISWSECHKGCPYDGWPGVIFVGMTGRRGLDRSCDSVLPTSVSPRREREFVVFLTDIGGQNVTLGIFDAIVVGDHAGP